MKKNRYLVLSLMTFIGLVTLTGCAGGKWNPANWDWSRLNPANWEIFKKPSEDVDDEENEDETSETEETSEEAIRIDFLEY